MDEAAKPGHYDKECEKILHDNKAELVLLMVVKGKKGHGMSCCINADNLHAEDMASGIPKLLRKMAGAIEKAVRFEKSCSPDPNNSWSDLAREKEEED